MHGYFLATLPSQLVRVWQLFQFRATCYVRSLSSSPQVFMGYKLTRDVGRTREESCRSRTAGEWFTNSSSLLLTSQVVYQPLTHKNLWWTIAFNFSLGLPAQ